MLGNSKDNSLEYKKLTAEEMASRGILGRLIGICADFIDPTRNGRRYSQQLWEKTFNDPIMKERIENGVCYGELGHPTDREETDMEKIAVCLAEFPQKGKDGKLRAVFDILDTPNGRILKALCDYGSILGVSSRGSGDTFTDYDGQEAVDPDTYECQGFDIVLIPAVKEARLQYVTESLDKKRYNKTLRAKLQESLNKANANDRKIMEEGLDAIGINLNEGAGIFQSRSATDNDRIEDELNKAEIEFEYIDTDDAYEIADMNDYEQAEEIICNIVGDEYYKDKNHKDRIYLSGNLADELKPNEDGDKEILTETDKESQPMSYEEAKKFMEDKGLQLPKDIYNLILSFNKKPNDMEKNESVDESLKEDFDINTINTFAKKLKLNQNEKELFIHDINNLRGDEWLETFESKCPECVEQFKKFIGYNDDIKDESLQINETLINKEFIKNHLSELIRYLGELGYQVENRTNAFGSKLAFEEIDNQHESGDINEEQNIAVANDKAIVEELQNTLTQKAELEQKVMELQEKLSVCYAKETKLTESMEARKQTIVSLTQKANKAEALSGRIAKLEEELKQCKSQNNAKDEKFEQLRESFRLNNSRRTDLKEELSVKNGQVRKLTESIKSLNEQIDSLKNDFEEEKNSLLESIESLKQDNRIKQNEYSSKLNKSNQLIEKYKGIAEKAVDKYIDAQSVRIGVSVNEIKNRLPESYNFKDIDNACDELRQYRVNMSKLPFATQSNGGRLNESIKVKATPSKNEHLAIASKWDDEVDEQLLSLANLTEHN